MYSCALTGHRILKKDFNEEKLKNTFVDFINKGTSVFYCGMAVGFDLTSFKILLELKQNYGIKLIACLPCNNQSDFFNKKEKKEYEFLLSKSDEKIVMCEEYVTGCMHMRNRYMVDKADFVLAYLYKNSGGTYYTVKYAEKNGKDIYYF